MYAKNILNQIGDIKKKDKSAVLNELTKGTLVGSSIGAGIGLLIGFNRKQNLLLSSFIGAVIGGGITRLLIRKK
jgi:hypothetical protein